MANEISPALRRKLMALARLHDEWQRKYGIDDAEHIPEGSDSENRRSPTREQELEFYREANKIMGRRPHNDE